MFSSVLGQSVLIAQLPPDSDITGNEWIRDDQQYFSFDVQEEGIYRLTYEVLLNAGIPVDKIKGKQFELFSMGQPVVIRVSTDGIFSTADYIEFFGKAQDGSFDALLYDDPGLMQLNPEISLYGQTRTYYLTWGDTPSSHQYQYRDNGLQNGGLPIQETYYLHSEKRIFKDFHNKPIHDGRNFIRYSSMDIGEGFGSKMKHDQTLQIPLSNRSDFGVDPKIRLRFATNQWSRQWDIYYNDTKISSAFVGGLGVVALEEKIPLETMTSDEASIRIVGSGNQKEKHSLAFVEVQYPRKFIFDNVSYISYLQQPSIISRYIEYQGFAGSNPILYNLDEGYYMFPEVFQGVVRTTIPVALQPHHWVLVDQSMGYLSVSELHAVDLSDDSQRGNYLILTNAKLLASGVVDAYAAYRSSPEGGNYTVVIQEIKDLYHRYGYGIKGHPLAIRNYLDDLRNKQNLPQYVFIIGKGYEYTDITSSNIEDLIPTFGLPGSDNLLAARRGAHHPEIPIGRLAVQKEQQVLDYLEKIRAQESPVQQPQDIDNQAWKKHLIHLSGGSADNQETLFRFLQDMGDVITNNTFGADIFTFRKTSADPIQTVQTEEIMAHIDAGASMITFLGTVRLELLILVSKILPNTIMQGGHRLFSLWVASPAIFILKVRV